MFLNIFPSLSKRQYGYIAVCLVLVVCLALILFFTGNNNTNKSSNLSLSQAYEKPTLGAVLDFKKKFSTELPAETYAPLKVGKEAILPAIGHSITDAYVPGYNTKQLDFDNIDVATLQKSHRDSKEQSALIPIDDVVSGCRSILKQPAPSYRGEEFDKNIENSLLSQEILSAFDREDCNKFIKLRNSLHKEKLAERAHKKVFGNDLAYGFNVFP